MIRKNITVILFTLATLSGCSRTEGNSTSASSSTSSSNSSDTSHTDTTVEEKIDQETIDKENGIIPVINKVDKTITYGLYPQTRVSSSSLLKQLNKITDIEENGFCLYENSYYYKYKAEPFGSDYTFSDGKTIVDGTSYWFKCEKITWNILSSSNEEYLLVSETLLDAHKYNDYYEGVDENGYYANNYENSSIRKWLKDTFFKTAFSLNDSYVMTTKVDNSASTTDGEENTYVCDDTFDKVFLLSYKDYQNEDYGFKSNNRRKCKTTDFSKATGALSDTQSGNMDMGYYVTRSPSTANPNCVASIRNTGSISQDRWVSNDLFGVRPAITLKLSD